MSTIINDLYNDGVEVYIHFDSDLNIWNVDVNDQSKEDETVLLAGFTDLSSEDDAEFLAWAWISGYHLAKGRMLLKEVQK